MWYADLEWMMHLYSAFLCIAVHPKRFTIKRFTPLVCTIFMVQNRATYSSWIGVICYSIPRCNKDPWSRKTQVREVLVYVLGCLCKDTAGGVLLIWDDTIITIVNICPEWSNEVLSLHKLETDMEQSCSMPHQKSSVHCCWPKTEEELIIVWRILT